MAMTATESSRCCTMQATGCLCTGSRSAPSAAALSRPSGRIAGGTPPRDGRVAAPFQVALAFHQGPARMRDLRGIRRALPLGRAFEHAQRYRHLFWYVTGAVAEGMRRLERYRLELGTLARRRSLHAGEIHIRTWSRSLRQRRPNRKTQPRRQRSRNSPRIGASPTASTRCSACASAARSWCSFVPGRSHPQDLARLRAMRRSSTAAPAWAIGPRSFRHPAWTRSPATCTHRVAKRRMRSIAGNDVRGLRWRRPPQSMPRAGIRVAHSCFAGRLTTMTRRAMRRCAHTQATS